MLALCIIIFTEISFAQKKSYKVGFILANTFVDRWNKDKEYFESKFNELGGEVIFVDCFDQVNNQIAAAEDLVNEGVDGIIIIAVDAVGSKAAVDYAKRANIPVIAYDRMILKADLDYYVSFNSVMAGEQMANVVISKVPKGKILYIGGPSEDYNSRLIRKGVFNVLDTLDKNHKISSLKASTWTQLDSYLLFQDYLSNGNDMPDAIICAADVLTRGVIDVLRSSDDAMGKVIVTGQDAELDICRMIVNGTVEMSIYKPTKLLAEAAAKTMWGLLNKTLKEEPETKFNNEYKDVPSLLLKPIVVNKKNMDEVIIKDGYYSKLQVYGK